MSTQRKLTDQNLQVTIIVKDSRGRKIGEATIEDLKPGRSQSGNIVHRGSTVVKKGRLHWVSAMVITQDGNLKNKVAERVQKRAVGGK